MTDCIIVGGGLIGMLSARELSRAGMNVMLLDKGELGKESSWAGGGILSPLHPWRYSDEVNRIAQLGHRLYPDIAEALHSESGVDPEYIRNGMLVLESQEQEQAVSWAKKWSVNLSVVSQQDELRSIEPELGQDYAQGLWLPDVAQMRNPRLVKAARGSLDALGIQYKENTEVEKISVVNGKANGVVVNGQTYFAEKVLMASGAWSAGLLSSFASVPEIQPVKGQMILFKGVPGLLGRIILAENRYLIPRKDGRILCGSSIEYSGFDKSTNIPVKQDLLKSALSLLPALSGLEIEHHWAGLRPGSPDGTPYIGEHKEIEGLYLNAGHYRNGVILGIGSAKQITEIMLST